MFCDLLLHFANQINEKSLQIIQFEGF